MPLYEFWCRACRKAWTISKTMDEISDHTETCRVCADTAERVYGAGMIRVTGGASPTRFSTGFKSTMTAKDDGFQREFNSIFDEHGPQHPHTKESYERFDDEGGSGPYMALPSQRESYKAGHEEALRRGTIPSQAQQDANRHAFHQRHLERARKRKRGKSAKWKGSRT